MLAFSNAFTTKAEMCIARAFGKPFPEQKT
jgi:hypothetical protein